MIKRLITAIFLFLSVKMTFGQSANVSFNGLGRLYLNDNYLKGNIIDKDSVSPNRGTGGYILFDLGLNLHASEMLKVTSIVRARNEFGGFFGDGASFGFRQFKMSGTFGNTRKSLKYDIGDLDLKMTEYTLFNFEEIYNTYEAEAFKVRRDITSYENFNFGNNWRLQGIQLATGLEFDKLIKSVSLRGITVRTKGSQTFQFPDRILVGGDIRIKQSKNLEIGANYSNFSDLPQTVRDPAYIYNNEVLSGDFKVSFKVSSVNLYLLGESGRSKFKYSDKIDDQSNAFSDFFYDVKLRSKVNFLNLQATIGYREVGPDFRSVGAQTRRTFDYARPEIFGQVDFASVVRSPLEYDRMTQPILYNNTFSPVLMTYNPVYNLVSPYGQATPNRKGITANIALRDNREVVKGDVTYEALSEVSGEGTTNKRKFLSVRGGAIISVNKLIGFNKKISIAVGGRIESSKRDILVDLNTKHFDTGLEVEVLRKIFLTGGYKNITASGKEYLSRYGVNGSIESYQLYDLTQFNVNMNESILLSGFKYEFNANTYFTVQYLNTINANTNNSDLNYRINQIFLGYTMKF